MFVTVVVLAMMQQPTLTKEREYNPTIVDSRHINVCDTYLSDIDSVTGSVAYRRLYFVSEALKAAEVGATEAKKFLEKQKTAKNFTALWTESLSSEQAWEDHMHCAAQIMGRYAPLGDTSNHESVVASLLVVAFNQEAHARAMLADSQKCRFTRESRPTKADEFADAEELHIITSEQDDAADSIRKMTMLVAAEAADMSGPEDQKISRLQLTCEEDQKINGLLKSLAIDSTTLFGSAAHEMLIFLTKLKCQ